MHAPLAVTATALVLAGCGSGSVSTSGFKGEEHEVAQAIANLQSDTSSQDPAHVCSNDLAQALVARLNQAPGGCERAIKNQLTEIDPGLEVKVESVHIAGAGTATAAVKSTFEGKHRLSTLELVKESGKWRISGLK
jgi:copper chaperone CopZ